MSSKWLDCVGLVIHWEDSKNPGWETPVPHGEREEQWLIIVDTLAPWQSQLSSSGVLCLDE